MNDDREIRLGPEELGSMRPVTSNYDNVMLSGRRHVISQDLVKILGVTSIINVTVLLRIPPCYHVFHVLVE